MADTPRVTVPVEPTPLSVCRAIAPYLGAVDKNDWRGLDDDDAISMPVKMRVGDLRDLKAVISAAPAPDGAIVRWRGENIPYTCPYPSIGVRGSPYGYNIDPGAGSGMDRLQRNWPDRAQVRDMRERDGEITPLFPSYALATREEAPAEAGDGGERAAKYAVGRRLLEEAALRAQPPARIEARDCGNGHQPGCDCDIAEEDVARSKPPAREDAQPVQIDPATVETAIGGSYDMPDGRKFWIDVSVAREMTNRVLAALQAEQGAK